jgi:inosine/xanthosine triphosphatase
MAEQDETAPASAQVIVVASKNPVKINAVHQGFTRMFPAQIFTVKGVTVPSEVPDQPLSDQETRQGAVNRVNNARTAEPGANYWVGLEGGIHAEADGSLQSFAWIVVKGRALSERTGRARTAAYYLPEESARYVREGLELGDADDRAFGKTNSKQANGSSGLLTDDAITRTEVYEQAVILALIPFKKTELTFEPPC